MCWNQHVSINTFTFSVFVLLLIYYNNSSSSPYKLHDFDNPYMYLFIMTISTMQLIEFFLWRNLSNRSVNYFLSFAGLLLLVSQPIASILLLKNKTFRNKLLMIYGTVALLYLIYLIFHHNFQTTVSVAGHLKWDWAYQGYFIPIIVCYLFFLYLPLIINNNVLEIIFTISLFASSYLIYYKDGSEKSVWCWSINAYMIYLLTKLLFYLPYQEKLQVC